MGLSDKSVKRWIRASCWRSSTGPTAVSRRPAAAAAAAASAPERVTGACSRPSEIKNHLSSVGLIKYSWREGDSYPVSRVNRSRPLRKGIVMVDKRRESTA